MKKGTCYCALRFLKLTCKMELYVFKVLLSHGKHIATVSEEHIPTLFILGHILILALLEVF